MSKHQTYTDQIRQARPKVRTFITTMPQLSSDARQYEIGDDPNEAAAAMLDMPPEVREALMAHATVIFAVGATMSLDPADTLTVEPRLRDEIRAGTDAPDPIRPAHLSGLTPLAELFNQPGEVRDGGTINLLPGEREVPPADDTVTLIANFSGTGPVHLAQDDPHGELTWCGSRAQFRHQHRRGTPDEVTCGRCKRRIKVGHPLAFGHRS